jgi:hypothetical protein
MGVDKRHPAGEGGDAVCQPFFPRSLLARLAAKPNDRTDISLDDIAQSWVVFHLLAGIREIRGQG